MGWALVLTFLAFCPTTFAATIGSTDLPGWDEDPASQLSLSLETQREVTQTKDGLTLVLKHLPKSDAEPVLLIHGLAENDRIWDSPVKRYSFARFLHAQGFDVWIGNLRDSGTVGFRSDTPTGAHRWTVDDYSIYDVPALVHAVAQKTGKPVWLIGHSLGAWAIEGYLADLQYDSDLRPVAQSVRANQYESEVKGVAALQGCTMFGGKNP